MRKPFKLSLAAAAVLALAGMSPAAFACPEHLQSSLNVVPINTISDVPTPMVTTLETPTLIESAVVETPSIVERAVIIEPAIQTEAWQGPIIEPAFPAPAVMPMVETRAVVQPIVIPSTCGTCF
jgi:hypothetical protein